MDTPQHTSPKRADIVDSARRLRSLADRLEVAEHDEELLEVADAAIGVAATIRAGVKLPPRAG